MQETYEKRERRIAPEITYTHTVVNNGRKLKWVRARDCKIGTFVSTSQGAHKVIGVYWSGGDTQGWVCDLLLRPADKEGSKVLRKEQKSYNKKGGRGGGRR